MHQPPSSVPALAAGELPLEKATLYPEDDGFFGRRAKARRAKLLAGIEEPSGARSYPARRSATPRAESDTTSSSTCSAAPRSRSTR